MIYFILFAVFINVCSTLLIYRKEADTMGLFDALKKLFHNATNNTPTIIQIPHQGNENAAVHTLSLEFHIDRQPPDIIPLNVLLKKAVPTKRGLYPHEILMLDYAHTYSTDLKHQHFQGFWYYDYSVKHPAKVLKSLEERGFIKPGDLQSAIQRLTVTVIKNELKAIGQKVTGKKADLIDRLLKNASLQDLEKKFPVRFFELTESGQQELKENQYVPYLHRHKYMSIWEMNDRLYHRNPRHFRYRDLIWQFFNEESIKHFNEGNMGFYRNTRLNMYEFVFEEKRYEQALNLLCEVIAYDLSGMNNNEFTDVVEKFRLHCLLEDGFPYSKSFVTLPPAIKRWLAELQKQLKLSDEDLRNRLLQQFNSISLYRRIFTNPECVDITMAELNGDTQTLNAIYHKAEVRVRKRLNSI